MKSSARASTDGCRLLIVSNIPTPNNDALFAELAKRPDVTLHVAYCAEKEPNRFWNLAGEKSYPCTFLPELTAGTLTRFNPGIFPLLRRFAPDVVIVTGGYIYPTAQLLAWWLTLTGRRWYYWAEELLFPREGVLRRLVRAMLRLPLRKADGILAIGRKSASSFRRLGIADAKIHLFRYYADTANFELSANVRAAERRRIREQYGIPENATVLLFIGQLIHRKAVDVLLRAFAGIRDRSSTYLVIVGDGPLGDELRMLTTDLDLHDRVRFTGFIAPAGLPPFTAAADALVVPSRSEGWGLVVSEGMAAGLPVVASDRVNAAVDLLEHGTSGYIFPVDDVEALTAVLTDLITAPERRAGIVARSLEIAAAERSSLAARRLIQLVCPERAAA